MINATLANEIAAAYKDEVENIGKKIKAAALSGQTQIEVKIKSNRVTVIKMFEEYGYIATGVGGKLNSIKIKWDKPK